MWCDALLYTVLVLCVTIERKREQELKLLDKAYHCNVFFFGLTFFLTKPTF